MENGQEAVEQSHGLKSNVGLKITCVVLALVAIGLGACLIINKARSNERTNCAVDDYEKNSSKEAYNGNEESGDEETSNGNIGFVYRTDSTGLYVDYGKYIVTKNGDLYFAPSDKVMGERVSYLVDSETGTNGKFTFEPDDISYYTPPMEEGQKINFSGYKLNISNVQSIMEVGRGQQKVGILAAIIAKDGSLSILKTEDGFGENVKLRLKKDIEKNVASVGTAYHGTGMYAVVYYRDGGSKKLDNKVFE